MKEFFVNIADKKIINMDEIRKQFNELKDGRYLIRIDDARKRSLPQNNYYWGVVVPMVRAGLYDAGFDEVRTNDQAHAVIKRYHLKNDIVSKDTGHILEQDGSTAVLTPPQFNDFIERVCRWAAEYLGIAIPAPNEQYNDYQDWQEHIEQDNK